MKKKMLNVLLAGGIIFGALVLAFPFFSSNAQKVEKSDATKEQSSALSAVQKNEIAKRFYDALQQSEQVAGNNWMLNEAYFLSKSDLTRGSNLSLMRFHSGKNQVEVSIRESDSQAKAYFDPISQGRVEKCDKDFCADGGQKVFSGNGTFHNLEFVKGNYHIFVITDSEETAIRFAGYAINAVNAN